MAAENRMRPGFSAAIAAASLRGHGRFNEAAAHGRGKPEVGARPHGEPGRRRLQ